MKIIGVDNFQRETVSDVLVAENITNDQFAHVMCLALNRLHNYDGAETFFKVVADDHKLFERDY